MEHGCPSLLPAIFLLLLLLTSYPPPASMADAMNHAPRDELVSIAGYGEEPLSSVHIIGTLISEACTGSNAGTLPVPGVKVAVACKTKGIRRKNWAYGTTDEFGDFMIDLPSHLHAISPLEAACHVKVLRIQKNQLCRPIPKVKSRGIRLLSAENGVRVYSAGTLTLNSLRHTNGPLDKSITTGQHENVE